MSKLDLSKDPALPKVRTYLAALFNESEKKFHFLPCFQGYLVAVQRKQPFVMWIHKNTIEGILRVGVEMVFDTVEDVLFNLVWGGWAMKAFVVEKFIPDPPDDTIVFMPGLHRVEFGTKQVSAGATGAVLKGVNAASDFIGKTGKAFGSFLQKQGREASEKEQEEVREEAKQLIADRTYAFIKFPDYLYHILSKEKKLKGVLKLSGGLEFRSVYSEAAREFVKMLEKSKFTVVDKGEGKFI